MYTFYTFSSENYCLSNSAKVNRSYYTLIALYTAMGNKSIMSLIHIQERYVLPFIQWRNKI